ncbi:uncharacterized protein LOC127172701 isoform X1 [Labeo rohita]|uniref:uncharacterized protein LOC127172701 isoform X1 n=1 Tax=Labeo rohita TaxID=84645 RepID=UPI0021E22CEA|nr:uncharacterized protein LOC127172701 isoform X1 [Labeo rohita]XP_050978004.1 uncharacterized protein LOC127172701 isoform X1 [Labeo rohita]
MALFVFIIFHLLLEVKSQNLPQAKLTIFPTFATDEEVQMVCGGHENQHMSECMFYPAGQENFIKPSASCNFSITVADLIAWSQDQESSYVNISCYYTVHDLEKNTTSPHSDIVSVRVRGLASMPTLPPEGSPATMIPNGTIQANLSTVSTINTTPFTVTSSTENTTDPITNMSSLTTSDSNILTDPANEFPVTTGGPEIKKYSNTKMFYFIAVVASGGGIVLTGLVGICLFGCTRKSKAERIWIEFNGKKQGHSLPMASSDLSAEDDTVLYSVVNFPQSPSQPPGNREESVQTEVEPNQLYYTILTKPDVSSKNRTLYSQLKVR